MITVRVYSNVGELIGPVALDLRKSDAAFRLQQALFEKGSGVVPVDLERLDVGTLPLATLAKVYTSGEIRKAIVRNAESLRKSAAAANEILAKVESENLWQSGRRIRKSKMSDECVGELSRCGYLDMSGSGERFAHPDGHMCSVESNGAWWHTHANGNAIDGRHAAGLKKFLAAIHEHDPRHTR